MEDNQFDTGSLYGLLSVHFNNNVLQYTNWLVLGIAVAHWEKNRES
jgi:hypothetical protein